MKNTNAKPARIGRVVAELAAVSALLIGVGAFAAQSAGATGSNDSLSAYCYCGPVSKATAS